MTIRQLQKVFDLTDDQHVRIMDAKNLRTIETAEGWVLEPSYDYEGYNYEEIERILSLRIYGIEFKGKVLTVWAH